jgi:hypothetical protein
VARVIRSGAFQPRPEGRREGGLARLSAAAAVTVLVAASAAAGSAVGRIPRYPPTCAPFVNSGLTVPYCRVNVPGVTVTVSPQVVRVGQEVAVTLSTSWTPCPGGNLSQPFPCYLSGRIVSVRPIFQKGDTSPSPPVPTLALDQKRTKCSDPNGYVCAMRGSFTWYFRVTGQPNDHWVGVNAEPDGGDPWGFNAAGGATSTDAAFWVAGPRPCAPQLAGSLAYRTGQTVIRYEVKDVSSACRNLALTAPGGIVKTLPSRASSGELVLGKRLCGPIELHLGDSGGFASLATLGEGSDGNVLYAHGDVTGPEGEQLRTGDELCTGEGGATFSWPSSAGLGAPPPSVLPRYGMYFAGLSPRGLERALKLRVGPTGALWFGIGTFGSEIAHPNGCSTQYCNAAAGEPVTGGLIDVPAAHVFVYGAIDAPRLVLGLGQGRSVTLKPPEPALPGWFSPGRIPFDDRPNLQTVKQNPWPKLAPLTGFAVCTAAREVFEAPLLVNGALGGAGRLDFRSGLSGKGAVAARGDITVRGTIALGADFVATLVSLGTIRLLGTS